MKKLKQEYVVCITWDAYNGHPLLYLTVLGVSSDDVIITGILSAKWSPDIKDVRSNLDPMLLANYVR
jgi:hypothetical protein